MAPSKEVEGTQLYELRALLASLPQWPDSPFGRGGKQFREKSSHKALRTDARGWHEESTFMADDDLQNCLEVVAEAATGRGARTLLAPSGRGRCCNSTRKHNRRPRTCPCGRPNFNGTPRGYGQLLDALRILWRSVR